MTTDNYITSGYFAWLKKRKKRHTRAMFTLFLEKQIELPLGSTNRKAIIELFYEIEALRLLIVAVSNLFNNPEETIIPLYVGKRNGKTSKKQSNKVKAH